MFAIFLIYFIFQINENKKSYQSNKNKKLMNIIHLKVFIFPKLINFNLILLIKDEEFHLLLFEIIFYQVNPIYLHFIVYFSFFISLN